MNNFRDTVKYWGKELYLLIYPDECLCKSPQDLEYIFHQNFLYYTGRCKLCGLKIKTREVQIDD